MELLKKKVTPIQNIAFMALLSAINVIFVLLSNIMPLLLFLLVFILPLTSTIVTICCKKRYYPVYMIVTLGLCIAVASGFNIFDALIYVFPSLIVGFAFGYFIEIKLPAILIIVITSIVQYGLTILTYIVLMKIINNFDILNGVISALGLADFKYLSAFLQIFFYLIALIQIVISYLYIKLAMTRYGITINLDCPIRYLLYIPTSIFIGLTILSYFYFPIWTMVFVIMSLPVYIYELLQLLAKKKIYLIVSISLIHLLFIFLFAFLYKYLAAPNQFMLLIVLFGLVTIIDYFDNYCFIKKINNLK